MILKELKYGSNWFGKNWSIKSGSTNSDYVSFNKINLIVGRNASGKTKFISCLRWLSDLFEDSISSGFQSLYFETIFQDKDDIIKYDVNIDENNTFLNETLSINDDNKLDRKRGKLYYENLERFVDFQVDDDVLVSSRRDSLQQPFFEILHSWGKNVSHYPFGEKMGRLRFEQMDDDDNLKNIHFKNYHKVRLIYHRAIKNMGLQFEKEIINDMKIIDYNITSINSEISLSYPVLSVQESDLPFTTNFENMSQGMARAFSLLVQLNYSLMAKIPSCILIDDIGEGLDYERSRSLIELIIKKVEGSNIQLFMTTNDRFVMNSVPLKYWSVIHREGNKSVFYNYQNSQKTFDDFAFTGLNNFDFFATDFYRMGFEEFIETAQ